MANGVGPRNSTALITGAAGGIGLELTRLLAARLGSGLAAAEKETHLATRNAAAPEAQVRELLDAWTKAVRARDLKAVLARHSPDIVMFDVPPPEQWRGLRKYRESWELFFKHFPREGGERFPPTAACSSIARGGFIRTCANRTDYRRCQSASVLAY
jgi:hypothetical protein